MRAVVVNADGSPRLEDVPEPYGDGELLRVRACGLCGSDVEKLRPSSAGAVLGHEVVGELGDGRRVALVHHLPCGECERCRSGHDSTCEQFRTATIVPGGFAERVRAQGGYVELPEGVDDAVASFTEPLACVLRGVDRVPRGRVLVLGGGFVGQLFAQVLRRRGDDVYVHDLDPSRRGRETNGPVDAVVVCAPGAGEPALTALKPGGTAVLFADAGALPTGAVYRSELTLVGSRSATPRHLREAANMLPHLDPLPTEVLPLDRFDEGLQLYRSRRALKVVFTP